MTAASHESILTVNSSVSRLETVSHCPDTIPFLLKEARHAYAPSVPALSRLYLDRVVGGNRHHRHPHRPAAAGRTKGPRSRQPHAVPKQPQTDLSGDYQRRRYSPGTSPP